MTDVTPTQHFTEPPPRFTEATLVKALEEHGIGRPSHVRGDHLDHHRPRLRGREGEAAPPGAGRAHRHGPAGGPLRRVRGRRVHGAHGGAPRRDRARRARTGCPSCASSTGPSRSSSTSSARSSSARTSRPSPSDEVCSEGPPDGHPARPQRSLPRLLAVSRSTRSRGHSRARSPRPGAMAGEGETCPQCGEGTLVQKRGRFGAFVGCSRYPDCKLHPQGRTTAARAAAVRGRPARRARRATSSPGARGAPAACSGAARATPSARFTTSREPVGAVHDADGGPVARNTDGTAICLALRRRHRAAGPVEVGELLTGGPPDPAAIAPSARRGGAARAARPDARASTGGTRAGRHAGRRRAAKPAA